MTDTIDVTSEVAALAAATDRLGVHIHKTTFDRGEFVAWVAAMEATGFAVVRDGSASQLQASIRFEGARMTVTYLGAVETREVTVTATEAIWPDLKGGE